MTAAGRRAEELWRELAPHVLGALVRRHGRFDACDDAVQDALFAASQQWPRDGVPENPRAWLIRVASRRLIDRLRSDAARRRREEVDARRGAPFTASGGDPAEDESGGGDDTLTLLFMCCHPALSAPSQLALTLRSVGGLTTAEIAAAFMVPEATMGQRISRAKATLQKHGASFALPPAAERSDRLRVVMQVLYLVYNEGYAATGGDEIRRPDLTGEAIRLARELRLLVPDDAEVAGLLALMLLTDAHRAARSRPDGSLVPLAEQDRTRWDRGMIAEGVDIISGALAGAGQLGPYQVQAAIAAVHAEAPTADATDWPQILALYDVLLRIAPSEVVRLNRAVAVAEVHGPGDALAELDTLDADGNFRVDVARGHFLEMAGDREGARAAFRRAARRTTSVPEQRYLSGRAARLA